MIYALWYQLSGTGTSILQNPIKNCKTIKNESVSCPDHQTLANTLEKTTEGILKAARLGDLKMLSELHREGILYFSNISSSKSSKEHGILR